MNAEQIRQQVEFLKAQAAAIVGTADALLAVLPKPEPAPKKTHFLGPQPEPEEK